MNRVRRASRKFLPNIKRGTLFKTIQPLPHETVTSWLQRFGKLHGVTPLEVLKQIVDIDGKFVDVDLELTPKEMNYLMYFARIQKTSFALNDALFRPLRKQVTFPPRLKNPYQWIVERPSGKKPHYGFCPACLREDEIPYWRLEWRFRHWKVCPDHLCWLQDRCFHCNKLPDPGLPYLVRHTRRRINTVVPGTIAQCSACGKNLYSNDPERPDAPEAEYYIRRQRALLSTLVNGYCILHPAPEKQDIAVAMKLLRLKKLHPVGIDFIPETNRSGPRALNPEFRFNFNEHLRWRRSQNFCDPINARSIAISFDQSEKSD